MKVPTGLKTRSLKCRSHKTMKFGTKDQVQGTLDSLSHHDWDQLRSRSNTALACAAVHRSFTAASRQLLSQARPAQLSIAPTFAKEKNYTGKSRKLLPIFIIFLQVSCSNWWFSRFVVIFFFLRQRSWWTLWGQSEHLPNGVTWWLHALLWSFAWADNTLICRWPYQNKASSTHDARAYSNASPLMLLACSVIIHVRGFHLL